MIRYSLYCSLVGHRSFRKFFTYIQEALPVRMRAIHVLNTEPILDKLLMIIKPFMEKKFYDMVRKLLFWRV
jgi:hypothetical protein